MKKIFFLLITSILLTTSVSIYHVSAGEESWESNKEYHIPGYTPELKHTLDGNTINFEWGTAKDNEFTYYKLVHSTTESEPYYPKAHTKYVGFGASGL